MSKPSYSTQTVAPHAGAWIEIGKTYRLDMICNVAPHAGAWIEISENPIKQSEDLSHPTRVRGLKLNSNLPPNSSLSVAPHAGAWIEIFCLRRAFSMNMSHPTRVRGLKCQIIWCNLTPHTSHPTRVRGLKYMPIWAADWALRRTPRGCVD